MKQNDLIMRSIFDDSQNFADVLNRTAGKKKAELKEEVSALESLMIRR